MKRFLRWLAFRTLRGEVIPLDESLLEEFDRMVTAEDVMRRLSEQSIYRSRQVGRDEAIQDVRDARMAMSAKLTYAMREVMSANND